MSAPTTFKFAIWAPDYSDEECLARRLSVRERHLVNAKKLTEAGTLKLGGAMLKDGTHLTDQPKMQGSLMIYEAESIDVVWKLIKEDIYYTGNVWDKERLQITPFKSAGL
ncbi:hypothetical protein EIP91_001078 [Steccherinum ochraceum]|uniref:YCII-related domain-containing protein n=1 Tax=Steccherinum ochraceum TaxID=92696 RepID=A0A4R0REL0_9APHY|nr:hypothetical protein EIP91_001078 [Steccherinum ochraceum]